jgi:hypothetical protein
MSNSVDEISPGNEPILFSSLPGEMVGPGRFELPTPRLSSVCSNQLSYEPVELSEPSLIAAFFKNWRRYEDGVRTF